MIRFKSARSRRFPARLLLCAALLWLARAAIAGDNTNATNVVPDAAVKAAEAAVIDNQTSLRSNLEVQDQLHELQLENERNRQEAAAAAARNAELLNMIEDSLASQRVEGLKALEQANSMMQRSNDVVLMEVRAFAAFGFFALVLAAVLHWRMVSHIKAVAANLSSTPVLGLGASEAQLLAGGGVERSTAEFLGAIERLEKRIHDMETSAQGQPHRLENGDANGGPKALAESSNGGTTEDSVDSVAASNQTRTVMVLLSKGQTLLRLDQTESALACFDEALGLDPANTETLLQRGAALERLQRLNEAIECYDRAIAADSSMTMAYLHKGGVFNRLERYNEALECYEQALKTQEKDSAPELVRE